MSQKFYGDLVLRPLPDGIHMEQSTPLVFWDKKGQQWEVRPGYRTGWGVDPKRTLASSKLKHSVKYEIEAEPRRGRLRGWTRPGRDRLRMAMQ